MDSGTYNNVRRDTNSLSPMPPATPGVTSYKTNVNRTKTRKWVEAKVQSYDGDDWGNEYDDEPYDEPAEPEPPKMAGTGRGQLSQSSRSFTQPLAPSTAAPTIPPYKAATAALRKTSGPPLLHVQTQPISSTVNPRAAPDQSQKPGGLYTGRPEYQSVGSLASQNRLSPTTQGSGLVASRFPPRQSSMTQLKQSQPGQQGPQGARDMVNNAVARIEQRSASTSPSISQTADIPGKTLPVVRPADMYRRTSEEKETTAQPRYHLDDPQKPPATGAQHIPPTLEPESQKKQETGEDRRLSVSPQLPDLVRMSGFGDDFFSMGPRYSTAQPALKLASISDDRPHETGGKDAGSSEKTQPASSAIEGPKLQPNPDIIMPRANEVASKPAAAPQQPTVRPQIPGSWVSESTSLGAGPEQQPLTSPMVNSGGAGTSAGPGVSAAVTTTATTTTEADRAVTPTNTNTKINMNMNTNINKENNNSSNMDMEPTTQIKHLPSSDQTLTTMAKISSDFGRPTGQHDDAVASAVISAGPGFHPTPPSLYPLKTDNSLARRAPPVQPTTSAPSEFAPTAPLKPHRLSINPQSDVAVSSTHEQTPTISTAGTGSPEKESDKLREEIIKSLGPSGGDAVLSQSPHGREPAPGELSRESTYLSDVYDDYLLAGEEKSLQETGDELKREYMMSANQSPGARNTGHPPVADIAPLSPQRGPKSPKSPQSEFSDRPRRFSWEQSLEQVGLSPVASKSPALAILPASHSADTEKIVSPQNDAALSSFDALHAHPLLSDGSASQRVSQVSSRGPDDAGIPFEPPSPLSNVASRSPRIGPDGTARGSQLSLAEEKEAELTDRLGSSSPELHPALAAGEPSPDVIPPLSGLPHDATSSQQQQPKVLTFREILNIASTEHRIQTFEETRHQFTTMDSGLANWLVFMQNQAEHESGEPFSATLLSPTQHSPTAQQQQFPNASAGIGRTPSGAGGGAGTQGFGAASRAAGTKSKELLHTAEVFGNKGLKTGMKLFNKGRSKLRERAAANQN
ncbi:hypothetical protein F4810DRAFT_664236 [Camillea tinctor]|nr:hypothetical protein F4810DRAFT_664236 [Camillea tinctor]